MNRQFKGIWIPKEIWLTDDLTLQEKIILVEIDSLETEDKGCYASNKHFSTFFKLTTQRVSQIIKSLEEKKYIKIKYITKNKEIIERQLRIQKPPFPEVSKIFDRYQENLQEGIKYSKEGYQENFKDNNTYNNNTNIDNNTKVKGRLFYQNEELDKLFKEFLELRTKLKCKNTERALQLLINKLDNYDDDTKIEMLEQSIMNSWKSLYEIKKKKGDNSFLETMKKEYDR